MADILPDVYLRFVKGDIKNPKPIFAGDSMDAAYPGKEEGWLTISEFSGLSFGWEGSEDSSARDAALRKFAAKKDLTAAEQKLVASQPTAPADGKGGKPAKKQVTLKQKEFSFSRRPSFASALIVKQCMPGKQTENSKREKLMVELVVCRPAGAPTATKPKDAKIPFFRLFFENVFVIKSQLSVSTDPVPDESIDFSFQKVSMETIWTDNATGKKDPANPLKVWFDFGEKGKGAGGGSSWGAEA